jgi:hypothetical protein
MEGAEAVYTGETPTKEGDWEFIGWNPDPTNVTGDMDCYAVFKSTIAYARLIVQRSIEGTYINDRVTNIGKGAFFSCAKLVEAKFKNATSVEEGAFANCYALEKVDLASATNIALEAFQGTSSVVPLSALILRNTNEICVLGYSSAFNNTNIAKGIGYIYVPSAFVDSYKAAKHWSTYASQFRALEDYTVDGTVTGELDPNKI